MEGLVVLIVHVELILVVLGRKLAIDYRLKTYSPLEWQLVRQETAVQTQIW